MRRTLVAVLLVLAAGGGCGASGTLTAEQVRTEAEAAHSAAAEGALLASDVARDRTTEPFARVHSGVLADQAERAAEALDKPARPAIEPARRAAERRAAEVAAALGRLHAHPTDRALAARLTVELERLAR